MVQLIIMSLGKTITLPNEAIADDYMEANYVGETYIIVPIREA